MSSSAVPEAWSKPRILVFANRAWRRTAAITFLLAMLLPLSVFAGFRFVGTSSVPMGIWFVHPGVIARGSYAFLCLPKDIALAGRRAGYLAFGNCPGNVLPLMKHIVALPGDRVIVTADGMRVNGVLLASSRPLIRDGDNKPVLATIREERETVAPGTVWVLGDWYKSWDSRYFGAVPEENILGVGHPIITVPAGS